MKRKRLYIDVETSPLQVLVWSLRDPSNANISHENIVKDRAIIVAAWKFEDEKKTSALTWDSRQCDKSMLRKFVRVLESSTELVGHNIDKFDLVWIRGRCLVHGIPFPPQVTTFDTLKAAQSKFRLPSNRLDYLGQALVGDKKLETRKGLWRAVCVDNDRKALAEMTLYCKKDVQLLERVFQRMSPWLDAKTTVAANSRDCPWCGSSHTHYHDTRLSAKTGARTVQFRCTDCGRYHSVSGTRYDANKPLEPS